jgi:hypothetical protein
MKATQHVIVNTRDERVLSHVMATFDFSSHHVIASLEVHLRSLLQQPPEPRPPPEPPTAGTTASHHNSGHNNDDKEGVPPWVDFHYQEGRGRDTPTRSGCSQQGVVQITSMKGCLVRPSLLVRGRTVPTCRLVLLPRCPHSLPRPRAAVSQYEAACEVHAASFVLPPTPSELLAMSICTWWRCRRLSIFVYFALLFYYIDEL